jgi:hypothetical protein
LHSVSLRRISHGMTESAFENRTTDAVTLPPARTAGAKRPAATRSKTTNRPLHGRGNRHTAQGRRVADLFDAYLAAMGNPSDDLSKANALAAAELKTAAEAARAGLLAGTITDPDQVIRLEGASDRAVRRLGIRRNAEPDGPSLQSVFDDIAAERSPP